VVGPGQQASRRARAHSGQRNDMENIPTFVAAGFLFTLTQPALWVSQVLVYGDVASRMLHAYAALGTAKTRDLRALFFFAGFCRCHWHERLHAGHSAQRLTVRHSEVFVIPVFNLLFWLSRSSGGPASILPRPLCGTNRSGATKR